ncbi:MAG: threonine synthase [Cytophagales bacterium]|nr:threonine synthase [Cytophagales bacterium]
MELYSTKHLSPNVSLQEAVLTGLPPDNGLYVPSTIPELPATFFDHIQDMNFREMALTVGHALLKDDIDKDSLATIVDDAFNFDTPVVHLEDNIHVLELFHGPTLAFKDYGARFMSRLMRYFLRNSDQEINILVATSGDTGGAVGYGFLGIEGIKVTILYPKGKVSEVQEKQLTTIGGNITTIEVDGNFDDCQSLVKAAFLDPVLSKTLHLTSANSINIARLIPQSFYYYQAYAQLKSSGLPLVVSVPSGNFGNLCGGLLAYQMGLPVYQFIASTNVNDVVPAYLKTGIFHPKPSVATISNAMDVGNPSNFPRILAIMNEDESLIKSKISGFAFDDYTTKVKMQEIHERFNYMMCPHTVVAYLGLKAWMESHRMPVTGVLLSTAHPAKFTDIVSPVIGAEVTLPPPLAQAYRKEKIAVSLSNRMEDLKAFLLSG